MRLAVSFVLMLWVGFTGRSGVAQQFNAYLPLVLPAGSAYPFPTEETRLIDMRNRQQVCKMRAHAWAIFSGLTQPVDGRSDTAVFESWFTKCDVFLNLKCSGASNAKSKGEAPNTVKLIQALEIPPQVLAEAEDLFLSGEPIAPALLKEAAKAPLAIVLYNQEALRHIRKYRLWDSCELDSINRELALLGSPITEREIPSFPPKTVVLKTEWAIVPHDPQAPPLYVSAWDTRRVFIKGEASSPDTPPPDGHGGWARTYLVDPIEGKCDPKTGDQRIPVSCFFHFKLTDQDAQAANQLVNLRIVRNGASGGDYAILLGLHVITREIPDWTWSTFWWHDHPNDGLYAEGRPDTLPPLWRHYLMDTTLSMRTPAESDGKEKICFNPYLETWQKNGVSSNCINCHSRSVYPTVKIPPIPWRGEAHRFPQDSYYCGETGLSFLWSIRDNVSESHQRFLQAWYQLMLQLR